MPEVPPLPLLRLSRVTATTTLLLLGALAAPAGPAAAATDTCTDDDRDVVAGAPLLQGSRGAVDVHRYGRAAEVLTRSSLGGGTDRAGDRFGAAVARDRAGSGCTLLAIGAPGVAGKGVVYLVVDSATGFGKGVGTVAIPAPGTSSGDRFGETVLISRSANDDPNQLELWVGAPRRDVGSATDAGAVERYRLTLTPGSGRVRVSHAQTLRQGTASVPGTSAESNDRFGEVLAGAEWGIVVGVPHENVGSAVDAGMVTLIGPVSGTYRGMSNLTQNSRGISGTAEAYDRFGAAVADCAQLVGAPGEDLGRHEDAGLVQVLRGCDLTSPSPAGALSQDSPGVPGAAETGDRFGAAVALESTAEDGSAIFVGVPGEDLGSKRDAGMVVGQYACGVPPCGWRAFTQGDGLAGGAEAGDAVGSSLHVRHFYRLFEGTVTIHETGFPLSGAPGEDLGSVRDAGAAYGRAVSGGDVLQVTQTYSGGPTQGLRFGTLFATDTYGYPAS